MGAGLIFWAFPVWPAAPFPPPGEPQATAPEQPSSLRAPGTRSRAEGSQQTGKGDSFKALSVGDKQDTGFSYCLFHDGPLVRGGRTDKGRDQKNSGGLGTDSSEPELSFRNGTFTGFVRDFPF